MKRILALCCLSGLVFVFTLQGKVSPIGNHPREGTEWCNVWITNANKGDRPRVLLVGDSITQGYYRTVADSLKDKAYCNYVTTSWSVCNPAFMSQLEIILSQYKYKVIHFNNGLHGFGYSEEQYGAAVSNAIVRIGQLCPETKIIIANNTPTKPKEGTDGRNERVDRRNEIIVKLADKHDLTLNDLNTAMRGHSEYYRDDYHFHGNVIATQGRQVAEIVEKYL